MAQQETLKDQYERRIEWVRRIADRMIERLTRELKEKQDACPHDEVDSPGSIFGETCLVCGLYLNNGF